MKVISNYKTTLSASMTSSQNTVPVTDITTTDGHTITAADFDSVAYLIIEPGNSNMEIVKVTGVTGSSYTGAVRGLAFYGGVETSVPANQKAHQSGSTVIMSNAHYYYDKLMDLDSAETVIGVKTFSVSPIVPTPSSATQAANKSYVDGVAIAGGANASSTVKGISKLSSDPSVLTNPISLNSEEVSATTGANKVVRANAGGKIDAGFIELETSNPGLAFSGNKLDTKIKANGGITKDASGLSLTSPMPALNGSALTNLYQNTDSWVIVPSSNLVTNADTLQSITNTSYVKTKEIQLNDPSGTMTVSFTLFYSGTGTAYARIYKNGVAYGTERSATTSQTFNESLSFVTGDLIQLYQKSTAGDISNVTNFRLFYDKTVKSIANTVNLN